MTALIAELNLLRRGVPPSGTNFGYPVAAGEKVYKGSIVGVNAAGGLQRPQTAGTVALVGVADRSLDNTASAAVSTISVEAQRGVYKMPVASASFGNIGGTVYAADDGTLYLTNGGTLGFLPFGTIVGIEAGATYVKVNG